MHCFMWACKSQFFNETVGVPLNKSWSAVEALSIYESRTDTLSAAYSVCFTSLYALWCVRFDSLNCMSPQWCVRVSSVSSMLKRYCVSYLIVSSLSALLRRITIVFYLNCIQQLNCQRALREAPLMQATRLMSLVLLLCCLETLYADKAKRTPGTVTDNKHHAMCYSISQEMPQ